MCQELQPQQSHEPLQPHEVPGSPWKKLATDLFQIGEKHYLLVADYFSKYPFVKQMSAPVTSTSVSREISALCSLMGKPYTIISDNGTQYTGKPFQDLCHWWGINHITSSPHYPRSNGFAERMVGTV